ncbi:hypothetical protein N7493_008616 [Penicillium malachiteum]|uniref:Uncharacterized protein n=1 Tax=Penicillium malachiteum TaxID=1324776 RepID=A0AAD6HHM1_9EURO|nr:hypothetical protein N7493_008616 [Penicillium malachiteum]
MPLSPGHLDWMAHIEGEAGKADMDLDYLRRGFCWWSYFIVTPLMSLSSPPSEFEYHNIELTEPVKGCFLVSPLTSLNLSIESYRKWFSVDVLGKEVQDEISQGYGWGMAHDVSEGWWEGLNSADAILITAGEEEVFRDHIIQLIDVFERRLKSNVTAYIADKEAHDGPLMDFTARRAPSLTTQQITHWIIAQLKD